MKILLICKASVNEGLGHLIRSLTLAGYIKQFKPKYELKFLIVSSLSIDHIIQDRGIQTQQIESEKLIRINNNYDRILLDMLVMADDTFIYFKNKSKKIISISPIFNQLAKCDILITRTKYFNQNLPQSLDVKAGLQYSIIRPDCHRIDTEIYKRTLNMYSLHIAISMGGTDQHNLTKQFLEELSHFNGNAVFWVILGEGYGHNYQSLIKATNKNRGHEIILAKTNKSLWNILSNCAIAILAGGITSYEAAYAGLPSINYYYDPSKAYLTDELIEAGVCIENSFSINKIIEVINKIGDKKDELLNIHKKSKSLFLDNPIKNVLELIK